MRAGGAERLQRSGQFEILKSVLDENRNPFAGQGFALGHQAPPNAGLYLTRRRTIRNEVLRVPQNGRHRSGTMIGCPTGSPTHEVLICCSMRTIRSTGLRGEPMPSRKRAPKI